MFNLFAKLHRYLGNKLANYRNLYALDFYKHTTFDLLDRLTERDNEIHSLKVQVNELLDEKNQTRAAHDEKIADLNQQLEHAIAYIRERDHELDGLREQSFALTLELQYATSSPELAEDETLDREDLYRSLEAVHQREAELTDQVQFLTQANDSLRHQLDHVNRELRIVRDYKAS